MFVSVVILDVPRTKVANPTVDRNVITPSTYLVTEAATANGRDREPYRPCTYP